MLSHFTTRRGALGMAAALSASGLLTHNNAYAQKKMAIMTDYFGALMNTSVVTVALNMQAWNSKLSVDGLRDALAEQVEKVAGGDL